MLNLIEGCSSNYELVNKVLFEFLSIEFRNKFVICLLANWITGIAGVELMYNTNYLFVE